MSSYFLSYIWDEFSTPKANVIEYETNSMGQPTSYRGACIPNLYMFSYNWNLLDNWYAYHQRKSFPSPNLVRQIEYITFYVEHLDQHTLVIKRTFSDASVSIEYADQATLADIPAIYRDEVEFDINCDFDNYKLCMGEDGKPYLICMSNLVGFMDSH